MNPEFPLSCCWMHLCQSQCLRRLLAAAWPRSPPTNASFCHIAPVGCWHGRSYSMVAFYFCRWYSTVVDWNEAKCQGLDSRRHQTSRRNIRIRAKNIVLWSTCNVFLDKTADRDSIILRLLGQRVATMIAAVNLCAYYLSSSCIHLSSARMCLVENITFFLCFDVFFLQALKALQSCMKYEL